MTFLLKFGSVSSMIIVKILTGSTLYQGFRVGAIWNIMRHLTHLRRLMTVRVRVRVRVYLYRSHWL